MQLSIVQSFSMYAFKNTSKEKEPFVTQRLKVKSFATICIFMLEL